MGPAPPVAAVRRAVRQALDDLPPDALVLAACSGGADSTALAAALAHEASPRGRARWRAGAVTVDHGLQPGSPERAAAVAAWSTGLGLDPVEVCRVQPAGPGGPEAAARRARYAALREVAGRTGAAAVLLGHTRDDQAETVLLGLARGSGARSLAGMAPVAGLLRRPLLDLDRATTRAACADQGLPVWDDPHNTDPAYARVRVRVDVLPAFEHALGPGVAAALARTARLLRADADALDGWAQRVRAVVTDESGALDAAALGGEPAAVRTRVLRAAALAAGCPATDLTAGHVADLDRLLTAWHGQGPLALPGGVAARRRCGRLLLDRTDRAKGT